MTRSAACLAALVALTLAVGCARPGGLVLPTGTGEPVADASALAADVFRRCDGLRTLTAEIGLSGRAGRQKLRARLLAGLAAPGALRLEAVAPFGPPGFILAADAAQATLVLPRDDRVLTGATPAAILEALSGLSLSPDDLRLLLAGCPSSSPRVTGATRYGTAWTVLELEDGGHAYLRARGAAWALAAIVRPGLVVEYPELAGAQPAVVRFRDGAQPSGAPRFDLMLRLAQVEVNVPVPEEAFRVVVPKDAVPISLDELREAGPMRDAPSARSSSS